MFSVRKRSCGSIVKLPNDRRDAKVSTARRFRSVLPLCAALVVSSVASPSLAVVVTDDFSDLNDTANPAWVHLYNNVGSTDQTWDASTGQYRLVAPSNGTVPGLEGYGFVGSYTGPVFQDVRVTVDAVEFPTGPFGSYFGVAARLNGDNSLPSTETGLPLRGYSYQYEAGANGSLGEMVLNLVYGDGLKDLRSQKGASITVPLLDPSKDYRLVFEVIGNVLHGQVFELSGGNLGPIVAEQFRNLDVEPVGNVDHDGNNATPQVPFEPLIEGYSGVYGVGYALLSDADFTIDNFKTETAVAGDYNHNGATDAADYVLWRKTLGQTGPTTNPPVSWGNMVANGDVSAGEFGQVINQADYDFWRSKFGSSAAGGGRGSGGGGGVPEPACGMLLMVLTAGLSCRRWRR